MPDPPAIAPYPAGRPAEIVPSKPVDAATLPATLFIAGTVTARLTARASRYSTIDPMIQPEANVKWSFGSLTPRRAKPNAKTMSERRVKADVARAKANTCTPFLSK